jgi:NAD-dependent SIR2 family protein deacetylase
MKKLLERAKNFYITHLYCGRCGKWRSFDTVEWNIRGQPKCPYCGNLLRTRTRKSNQRNLEIFIKKLKLIELMRKNVLRE